MKYVGQTGRPFRVRFQEHFRDYKNANNKSKFAQHLLEHSHSIGPIENMGPMEWLRSGNLESWESSQHLLLGTEKPRKTRVEVTGRRTFRILTSS